MTERHHFDAPPERVALFTTCLVDLVRPELARATRRILERAGVEVEVPGGQTCCGQPAWNAGHREAARPFIEGWLGAFGEHEAVVSPSGSCVAMVRHHFPHAFEGERRVEVERIGSRTFELSEFLVDVLGVTELGARLRGRAAFHPACHGLRGLGLRGQPLALLERVEGLEVIELPAVCCGFGGLFSVRFPEVSVALADRRAEAAGEAELLVSGDLGCLMHLGGRLRRLGSPIRPLHLAEVLAGADGGPSGEGG